MDSQFPLFRPILRLGFVCILVGTLLILLISAANVLPEGDVIAFMYNPEPFSYSRSDPTSDWDIHLLEVRTGLSVRLTDYPRWDRYPAWSPDGEMIAFHSDRSGSHDIYLMNADGTNVTPLNIVPHAAERAEAMVAWSPDGEFIAFHSGLEQTGSADDQFDIYVTGRNVTNARIIAPAPGVSYGAHWSPDGEQLVYASSQDRPRSVSPCLTTSLYIADVSPMLSTMLVAQRDPLQRLTWETGDASSFMPAWSPDGETIAYEHTSSCGGQQDIYTIKIDGSAEVNVTNSVFAEEVHPEWLPNSERILFASDQDGDYDLYIMDADGRNRRRLTDLPGDEVAPAWRPTN